MSETKSGQKVLVNDEGGAFAATDGVIAIWNSFNGNTVQEVADELGDTTNRNPNELITPLNELAMELVKADLLAGSDELNR